MRCTLLYILLLLHATAMAQPYGNIASDACRWQLKGKVKEMVVKEYPPEDTTCRIYEQYSYTFDKDGFLTKSMFPAYDANGKSMYFNITHNTPVWTSDSSFIINQSNKPESPLILADVLAKNPQDTVWAKTDYTIINDTVFKEIIHGSFDQLIAYTYCNNGQVPLRTEIYNVQHGDTISASVRTYTYDQNRNKVKETVTDNQEEKVFTTKVKGVDKHNNPTYEIFIEEGKQPIIKTKKYTYYE